MVDNGDSDTVQKQSMFVCNDQANLNECWLKLDGTEKLASGMTKPVQFSIQEIPKDGYEEVISHMIKYFLVDEVTCKYLKFTEDEDAIEDLRLIWNYILKQNVSIGAYKIDSNNIRSELVAVNILCLMTTDLEKEFEKLTKNVKSTNTRKLLTFLHQKSELVNVYEIYGVNKYISGFGLSVAPAFRGQKLGVHLLQARNFVGQKYEVTATSTIFTSPSSQIQAERAGFKTAFIENYSKVLDENKKPLFPNINEKEYKIMIKELL